MAYRVVHRAVGYTAEQLFDLVLDVERYPAFVPGWEAARVSERREGSYRTDQIVRLLAFRQRFRSVTTFERPHRIEVNGQGDGVKHIKTSWQFVPQEDGCTIELEVSLALSVSPLQRLAETASRDTTRQMLTAFMAEAERRFGTSSAATNNTTTKGDRGRCRPMTATA
jgi:coenzyme Q-binding protein COQ10